LGSEIEHDIGSSIYVSHDNFCNEVHRDHDCNPLTFGIWTTTRSSDKKIERSTERIQSHIKGGQFFFPDYGVAIDFNNCGGIACVTWRSSVDRHATAFTETVTSDKQYVRWGSSIQVTARTFKAAKNIQEEGGDVRDASAYAEGREGSGVGIQAKKSKKKKARKSTE
jgi:hypothetical protein